MTRFSSFHALREWFHGRDDAVEQKDTAPDIAPAVDDADELPSGPCVNGEEHDRVEVRAATARQPLYAYCRVCRVSLPVE